MSWGTTLKNFASNWLTPYAWTPTWAPKLLRAITGASAEELFPHVNPKFAPFIMDEVQHDAFVAATMAQKPLEWSARFIFVPLAIGLLGNLALKTGKFIGGAVLSVLPVLSGSWIPRPIRWIVGKLASLVKSILDSKIMRYFVIPEAISAYLHTSGPKLFSFYEKIRPLTHAFMRPFFERILPWLGKIIENEGFAFSLRRMFVSSNPNAVSRWMGRIGAVATGRYSPANMPETMAPYAYDLGEDSVRYVARALHFVKDVFESTTQILPSISSVDAFKDSIAKLEIYFESQLAWLSRQTGPVADAARSWAGAVGDGLVEMLAGLKEGVKDLPSNVADKIANALTNEDSGTLAKWAATGVGYAPTAIVAGVLAYTTYLCAVKFKRGLERSILGFVGYFPRLAIFNNNGNVGGAAALPPVPANLQAHLQDLLGHPEAQHADDWQNMQPGERQWLNQALLNHHEPQCLHNALVGMGINDATQEGIVRALAANP